MFFNIGAGEMMLIAIVLLIAVGPEQLPGVIRKVGRTMGQLKSMSDRLRDDFVTGMNQIEEASDVKSWADKLETPWAEKSDDSWARNIDPPFTARRAADGAGEDGDAPTDEVDGSVEIGSEVQSEPQPVDSDVSDSGPDNTDFGDTETDGDATSVETREVEGPAAASSNGAGQLAEDRE